MKRILLSILLFGASWLPAEDTMPLPFETAELTADWPEWRWTILAGDDALKSGLPAMAESLYRSVLEDDIPDETRQSVQLKLASALIAQRRFALASHFLRELPSPGSSAVELRRAIVALNTGNREAADEALSRVNDEQLSRSDRPWAYLIRGLMARTQGRTERFATNIERAMELSVSPIQRAQFDTLLMTARVVAEAPTEEFATFLENKARENQGTRPGFGYAREYAVVLDQLGQKASAIDVLQEQLRLITADEPDERQQTLLLVGLIAGPETRRGQLALEDILKEGRSPALPRIALYLLAEVERDPAQTEVFLNLLQNLLDDPNCPIRDEVLLLRARTRLKNDNREGASADAERLLAEFPASIYSSDAHWILAQMAWEAKRYRSAADYLQKIRDGLPKGQERTRLSQLIGDCYFQNADYATAAAVYTGAMREATSSQLRQSVAYQAIFSEIRAGNLDQATALIDSQIDADPAYLWRAEWNLVEALRRAGKSTEAYARLSLKLRDKPMATLQTELRLRLMWLWAFVYYEAGQFSQVPTIVSEALTLMNSEAAESLKPAEKRLLASSLTLLEGQAALRAGNSERALELFGALRSNYPGTEATIASYLIEARYLAGEYRLVEAQRRLRELADNYPDSPLAPSALLEAAALAEKQGQKRNFEEARDILNVLIERYPGQPITFHAKLQLGNIGRKQNLFGAAQIVYENILQEFNGREKELPLYLAELYRADSLLAQAGGDTFRLDSAAEGLDRVLDNTNTPVDARIEAGYKLALIFIRQGNSLRARETLWLMVTRILKDPPMAAQMGSRGRYWMTRSLLELGNLLESNGSNREAREVYKLIQTYGLPGDGLVRARMDAISATGS